ncbi:tRNA pseudouridine(55) synthase TruB [Microcoleus sp. FACHB-1515]|uniref:tRNA pseudouridine(55) synthase TruB n=1 Tax=Cyanophyceae TaxID=3028117 RepID=UPI001689A6A0|nr:tRNA pseudouridine(55) synthase TruB [Microcoleus sp. FACHB-1515]MBD2090089.1 tRNA pseudouridine(55) synthase TruB [Microcoleus sp. FACHB-1515]
MQGFLNLNKPAGFTSHDCVARVRRLLKLKRVGHAGTLDPAATGVLPIAIGNATRLLQFLQSDKAYRATIRFGIVTTTDDLEGEVLHQAAVPNLDRASVEALIPQFSGSIAQIPPRYSAIQVQGKRLYDLARSGLEVEVPVRTVRIDAIEIQAWRPGDFPELEVDIACGAGTYIRSIARDLGDLLGTGGTLAALIRTRSSGFDLADSLTLEELSDRIARNIWQPISPDVALNHLPIVTLDAQTAKRWCQGQKTPYRQAIDLCRVEDEAGKLLGIAKTIATENGWLLRQQVVLSAVE